MGGTRTRLYRELQCPPTRAPERIGIKVCVKRGGICTRCPNNLADRQSQAIANREFARRKSSRGRAVFIKTVQYLSYDHSACLPLAARLERVCLVPLGLGAPRRTRFGVADFTNLNAYSID
jgi:hypothetical protein